MAKNKKTCSTTLEGTKSFCTHLSQVTDLLVSHFHKDFDDEVDRLRRVAVDLSNRSKSQSPRYSQTYL